jgi:hypothetical protein
MNVTTAAAPFNPGGGCGRTSTDLGHGARGSRNMR